MSQAALSDRQTARDALQEKLAVHSRRAIRQANRDRDQLQQTMQERQAVISSKLALMLVRWQCI